MTDPIPPIDLSKVTLVDYPELPTAKMEALIAEIEAITRSNLENAAKWKSYLAVLHTALRIAAAAS